MGATLEIIKKNEMGGFYLGQFDWVSKGRVKTAESRREINTGVERPCGREHHRLLKQRRIRRFYTILDHPCGRVGHQKLREAIMKLLKYAIYACVSLSMWGEAQAEAHDYLGPDDATYDELRPLRGERLRGMDSGRIHHRPVHGGVHRSHVRVYPRYPYYRYRYGPYRPIIRYINLRQGCGYQVIRNGAWSRTVIVYHNPSPCSPQRHVEISYGWDWLGTGYNARCMKYHDRKPFGQVSASYCQPLTYRWVAGKCQEVFRGGVRGIAPDEFCGQVRYVFEQREGATRAGCYRYRGSSFEGPVSDQRLCGPQRFEWDEYDKCFEHRGDSLVGEVHWALCSDVKRLQIGYWYLGLLNKDLEALWTALSNEPDRVEELKALALRSQLVRLEAKSLMKYRESNDFNTLSRVATKNRYTKMCNRAEELERGSNALYYRIADDRSYGDEVRALNWEVATRRRYIEAVLLCEWPAPDPLPKPAE